jgi:hypothetical protein
VTGVTAEHVECCKDNADFANGLFLTATSSVALEILETTDQYTAVGAGTLRNGDCLCFPRLLRLEAPIWATLMTNEQENGEEGRTGILPALGHILFGKSSPKATAGGMTFDERVRHIASILAVRRRGERENLYAWAREVHRRFLSIPPLKALTEGFPWPSTHKEESSEGFPPLSAEERLYERQIRDFIETGLRLAQEHPVSAFGSETQYLIAQSIDERLWDSGPMKLIKWVGPILVALFFGGAIYGGYKFEGLREIASHAQTDIEQTHDRIQALAKDSEHNIERVKDQALVEWKAHLDSAATSAVDSYKVEIETAKNKGIVKLNVTVNNELEALSDLYSDIRRNFGEEAEKNADAAIVTRRDIILGILQTTGDGVCK